MAFSSNFQRKVIDVALQPKILAYVRWLDFGTNIIDWSMWEAGYNATLATAPDWQPEMLLRLLECVAKNMAMTGSYIGNIELQLITHSMISYCFAAGQDGWREYFARGIDRISENTVVFDKDTFKKILNEVKRRVLELHSPVIDCEFLAYPIGKIMGIDNQSF